MSGIVSYITLLSPFGLTPLIYTVHYEESVCILYYKNNIYIIK